MYSEVSASYKEKGGSTERKMKIWAGLSGSEDLPTAKAAGGGVF